MTTCKNCYTNGNCQTCPERSRIITEFELESANAEKMLDQLPGYLFGAALVIVSLVMIVWVFVY